MSSWNQTRGRGRSLSLTAAAKGLGILSLIVMCVVSGISGPAFSQDETESKSTTADQTSLSITIYNTDLGLVKDVRDLRLSKGTIDLKFEGVAARIDPTSVHIRSLNHPNGLKILEQNFEYDLISPAKLMEKYLGHSIQLVSQKYENDGWTEVWSDAKLVGTEGGYVYEMNGKIAVNPPGRVVLPDIPDGLISKPTLIWMLDNDRPKHRVEASYLTGGISWKSNYVVVLSEDDTSVDLSGWVTINNRSGATYEGASIKLVAGDVHRAPVERLQMVAGRASSYQDQEQFQEKAFFEYHLYSLQRKSTIKDNQTKQIKLLDAENVGVTKTYVYSPPMNNWFSAMRAPDKATKIGVFLSMENSTPNHMGMPLPKGVVRVYKKDDDEALQFVGEDRIDHTPEDEVVRVKLGDAFDIVGERVQTDFKILDSGHLYESAFSVTLRNHKEEDVVVEVIETIPGDWKVLKKSHDYEKESSNRLRFSVPVGEKASAELTYRVRIKY